MNCYATVGQLISDLRLAGDDGNLLDYIKKASQFIERRLGNFYPVVETRKFPALPWADLKVDPLLSVTSIQVSAVAITDFDLYPANKHWKDGPYTRVYRDGFWDDTENEITGEWGKYKELFVTGLAATQTANDVVLTVTNGSMISPGMLLLIGAEAEFVTGTSTPTAATSLVNGAITDTDEVITVDNGAEFFVGEVLTIDFEDLYIRKISGNQMLVIRGWNNTTKATHLDDAAISVLRSYSVSRAANGTTATVHNNAGISQYLPPADVNWLCREIAGLMRMKALTGFSGRSGNSETGESFYYNEFPKQIADVERNYRIVTI